MRNFTKEHAVKIAKKLECRIIEGKAHTIAEVFSGGVLIAHFGIRRGSAELGHDHLPSALHLRRNECKALYQCTLDRDGYLKLMQEMGEIPSNPAE